MRDLIGFRREAQEYLALTRRQVEDHCQEHPAGLLDGPHPQASRRDHCGRPRCPNPSAHSCSAVGEVLRLGRGLTVPSRQPVWEEREAECGDSSPVGWVGAGRLRDIRGQRRSGDSSERSSAHPDPEHFRPMALLSECVVTTAQPATTTQPVRCLARDAIPRSTAQEGPDGHHLEPHAHCLDHSPSSNRAVGSEGEARSGRL
jgi:hypothetical protein